MSSTMTTTQSPLSARAIGTLAASAAIATSTSYVLQPELHAVARDLDTSVGVVGALAAAPMVGYLLGLALLVPLVDRVRPDRLVTGHLAALAAALLVTASATTTAVLGVGLFAAGLFASTGAQMSSLAGRFSDPTRRGRAVGTVTAGISSGIVLGRILGGTLADWCGWRVMLVVFAATCVLLAAASAAALPDVSVRAAQPYRAVVAGLPALLRTERTLRVAAAAGALWFGAFSLVWVGFSLALAAPPVNLSAATIGVYSLAGLLGVAATRTAGAVADRVGSRAVVVTGLLVAAACALTMSQTLATLPVLLVALAVFDGGLFAAQVANQTAVLSIDPARAGQLNGAYMVVFFVGGSIGTAAGGSIVDHLGWTAVGIVAAMAILAAAIVRSRLLDARPTPPSR